jgi:hypothetical protein
VRAFIDPEPCRQWTFDSAWAYVEKEVGFARFCQIRNRAVHVPRPGSHVAFLRLLALDRAAEVELRQKERFDAKRFTILIPPGALPPDFCAKR